MAVLSLVYTDQVLRVAARRYFGFAIGSMKLASGVVVDGVIKKQSAFQAAFRSALRRARLEDRRWQITVALPESRVFTKIVTLPPVPLKELDQTLKWQANQFLPNSANLLAIDYQLLTNLRSADRLVLVIASPRELIDSLWQTLTGLNCVVRTVVPRSAALAQLTYERPHTPELLVEVEDDNSLTLIITKNRTARFSTNVAFARTSERVRSSLEQAIRFYEARDGQKRAVANILILPGPRATEIFSMLRRGRVIRPVRLLHAETKETGHEKQDEYLVNFGLLKLKTHLNLLLPEYHEELDNRHMGTLMHVGVYLQAFVAIVLLGVAGLGWQGRQVRLMEAENNLEQIGTVDQSRVRAHANLVATLGKTQTLEGKRSTTSEVLERFYQLQTPEIIFISFEYSAKNGTVTVIGQRATRAGLASFARQLLEYFPTVQIPPSDWSEELSAPFHIVVKVR